MLFHVLHFDGHLVDLPGETRCHGSNADAFGDGRLIVKTYVSRLIGREKQGLRFFDTPLCYNFSVDRQRCQPPLSAAAPVVPEVERDRS